MRHVQGRCRRQRCGRKHWKGAKQRHHVHHVDSLHLASEHRLVRLEAPSGIGLKGNLLHSIALIGKQAADRPDSIANFTANFLHVGTY